MRLRMAKVIFLLVKFLLITIGDAPIKILGFFYKAPKNFSPSTLYHLRQSRRVGRPKKFRFPKKLKIMLACLIFIIFFISYTFFILTAAYELPTPERLNSSNKPLTTEFYDRNGTLLYRLYDGGNRSLVKLSGIPGDLVRATVATEDKNFYRHFGIDPEAIVRALYHNITTNSQEGASTITQQLIKNSMLNSQKSYSRKIREAILALWAERIYSKDQILQMYFNEAPYGGSITGIAAAAQTYFNKSPSQLNLAQSAYLAGLPASPTEFSPYGTTPDLAKERQKEVLERMAAQKYITAAQADAAFKEDLKVRPLVNDILAPHFVFYIRDLLTDKYGSRIISQGGLKIYTSLDLKVQQTVETILKNELENLNSLNVTNGAAMVIDAQSGQILAMVGSRDYHYPGFGNFNVTTSLRQPGSSIKPVTYASAFEKGYSPNSVILDSPVTFQDEWGNAYSPVNYDSTFHGPVTVRQALGSSLNIPAVKLLATIGMDSFAKTAKDLGITTFDNYKRFGLSITLGGADVKMIEIMGVYDAFSQQGKYIKPTGILKVTNSEGIILEEYKPKATQALSPQIAYLITNILSDDNARKMAFGANSLLNIPGFEVAVKTGTSDNKRDNWTFGYTPKYVVGVWVGNPDNSPMNPALTSGITGAAPIWNKIVHTLLDGTEPLAFEKPGAVAEAQIDGILPKTMVRVQKGKDKTIFSDAYSTYATTSAQAIPAQPNL